MPDKPSLTASEVGTLWMTYQQETLTLRMLEYFIEKADDKQAKQIMTKLFDQCQMFIRKIADIFQANGAAVPVGFTSHDVNVEAPKLFDNGFDIMFVRLLKEIGLALQALNVTMSYREDIIKLYQDLSTLTQSGYKQCTQYLLENGLLARPPYVTMPNTVTFVKDRSYLGGSILNPLSEKRTLNTIEVSHLHHAIESNATGMNMMIGFAQCAAEPVVKKYFAKGADLAKSIVSELSDILLQSDINVPVASGGQATRSTTAPFSDKMMMYCTGIFCGFAMGSSSLGTAFSWRNDLAGKMTFVAKDILEYAHEGGTLMIKQGWMEEPPQMSPRKQLTKV